jgi:WD40 repeat protein
MGHAAGTTAAQITCSRAKRTATATAPGGSLATLDIEGRTFYNPDQTPLTGAAINRSGQLAATGAADGTAYVWPVSDPAATATLRGGPATVGSDAFSPDASLLAVGHADCRVAIWDFSGARHLVGIDDAKRVADLAALSPPTPPLATGTTPVADNGLAYSPDGRTMVTAGSDGTAQVWNLNPADEVRNLCAALRGPQLASQWRQLPSSPGPDPCSSG